jgi:cell division septation protein DedD
MREEDNANQLAQSLRLKSFPAFVFQRHSDHLYRVVVGPYPDSQSVHSVRNALEKEGIKPIIKRWTP